MKRIIALLMVLVLGLSLVPACAEESAAPQYSTTKSFINELEARSLLYTYYGMSNGNEIVYFGFRDDEINKAFTAAIFFNDDLKGCDIFMWNIIEYDTSKLIDVVYTCNDINNTGSFAKFYADTSDNTVTAECNVIFTEETAGIVTLHTVIDLLKLASSNYLMLAEYAL